MQTEIPQALKTVVFKLLKMNVIYDLVTRKNTQITMEMSVQVGTYCMTSTLLDLVRNIHSGLAEDYILAIDAKIGRTSPSRL